MDLNCRRSSLRKSIFSKDDEHTAVVTPRLKRRISFSGRHLVREFHGEEEPKTWENSYEISDHLNVDETASKLCAAKCRTYNFSVLDKENIPLPIEMPLVLDPTDSKKRSKLSETAQNGFVVSDTHDLINSAQNYTPCIENSVDITLFEKENQCFRKNKNRHESVETYAGENTAKNINSLSLDENEVRVLTDLRYTILDEKTVDFMQDMGDMTTKIVANEDPMPSVVEYECNGGRPDVTVYSESMDEVIGRDANEAITIYMNDSLSVTHPEIPISTRKTIHSSVTIMVSPENISGDTNVTKNSSCIMDFTGNCELPNISANATKEANEFQEKLDKISFLQHSDDEIIIDASLTATEKETESNARAQKRQTIFFSNAMESSPVKFKEDCMSSSIYSNEYITESPAKTTFSKAQASIAGSSSKINQPPKSVVRKICTQSTKTSDNTHDFEDKCIQAYHRKKQVQNEAEVITVSTLSDPQSAPLHESSLSFSLSNIKMVSLSPDSFAQLIPTEYKTYNFKQLNDEIDRGKIQVFPKTPTTDRKSKENIHFTKKISELPKERRTLFFEDDIPMSPDITSRNVNKPLDSDDFDTTSDMKQKKCVIAKCRFSQADDLMLDNTSFLARAKLGDETTSRNSTKRDLTQLNDIDIFIETKDERRRMGCCAIEKLNEGINTTNCSLHSKLKDAKPAINLGVTNIEDSSMEMNVCYIGKSAEEHIADLNVKHKHRQTIYLNEDIVLSKNEMKESSFKPESRNHIPRSLDTDFDIENKSSNKSVQVTGTTFLCNDKMDLHETHVSFTKLQSEHALESGTGNHVSDTILTDNSMQRDLRTPRKVVTDIESNYYQHDDMDVSESVGIIGGRHMAPLREEPSCHANNDIDMCCTREHDHKTLSNLEENNLKFGSQRKTIYFENYSIEKDLPVVYDDSVIVAAKPFNNPKTDNNNAVSLNDSVQIVSCTKRPTRGTLYFTNTNIEYDEHSREHPKCHSVLNASFKGSDDPFSETLHFHNDIILAAEGIKNTDYFDIEDLSHCETLKTEHSQCKRYFGDGENIKSTECQQKIQFHSGRTQTLCVHNLTETDTISQQQSDGMVAAFRETPKNTMDSFDANMDISIKENTEHIQNDSKIKNIAQSSIYLHSYDKHFNESTHESNVNDKYLISAVGDTATRCNLESQNTRKTILLSYGMDIDEAVQNSNETVLLPSKKKSSNDITVARNNRDFCRSDIDRHSPESKSTRRTLYFNEEISETEFFDNLQGENNEITKNTDWLHIPISIKERYFNDEIQNLEHDSLKAENISNKETYADNNVDILMKANMKNEIELNSHMETAPIEKCTSPIQNLQQKTIIFSENYKQGHIKGEQSLRQKDKIHQNETFAEFEVNTHLSLHTSKSDIPNADEVPLSAQYQGSTLRKSLFKNILEMKNMGTNRAYFELATPRKSLDEFLAYEIRAENEGVPSSKYNENAMKRTPENITPVSSEPKRLHTLKLSEYEANKSETKCGVTGIETSTEDLFQPSISDFVAEDGENITDSIEEVRKAKSLRRGDHSEQIRSPECRRIVQPSTFEDNPITISDVSVYFHDQRKGTVNNCDMTNIVPIEEIKCKNFHKRYMNLTCDSPLEDIDQTRISLVRTLSDEDVDESKEHSEEIDYDVACYEVPETCIQIETQAHFRNIDKRDEELEAKRFTKQLQNHSLMCRKCKRCQLTFTNESTSITTNSFVLPLLPPTPTLDMNRLRRLRARPHISDVNVLWQRSSLNSTIINLNNISDQESMSFADNAFLDCPEVTTIIEEYKSDIHRFVMAPKRIKSTFVKPSLVCHLKDILRHSNWVLDVQKQYKGTLVFIHRKMLTFSLVVNYEEADELGATLQLKSVKYDSNHVPQNIWEPIDFILDFQFKLNSPYDLLTLCENYTEPGVTRMIRKIDQICIETILLGVQLQRIVFQHGSSIIRDENRTFVRKIVRKIVSTPGKIKRVEKVEFRIEMLNIKKMCFKDITMPPLYRFSEDIHLLPVGLSFLNKFLHNPLGYLKHV